MPLQRIKNIIAFVKRKFPDRTPMRLVDMKDYYVVYAPLEPNTHTPQDLIGIDFSTGQTWDFVPTELQNPLEYFRAKSIDLEEY